MSACGDRPVQSAETVTALSAAQPLTPLASKSGIPHTAPSPGGRLRLSEAGARSFCLALVDGVLEHRADIDRRISQAADNWRVERMATVDRNVLRLGAYELLYTRDIPAGTVFDEAIELARRFGGPESPGFVNGVLDQVRKNVDALRAEMGLPPRGDQTAVEKKAEPAEEPGNPGPDSEPSAQA